MIDPKHYAEAALTLSADLDTLSREAREQEGLCAQAGDALGADRWHARLMLLTELHVALYAGRAAGALQHLSPSDLEG